MTSPRVLMLGSSSDSHANAIFEALSDGPLVVVDFPSEFSEPFPVSGTCDVSTIRSVRGVETTDLEQSFNNLRGVVNVGAQLLGGVDAIVVTPREALEAWVTDRSSLRLFRRLGIGEVVLVESTDGGWERARAALHLDGVEGVRVSAVRPRDGGRRRNYPERPLATVLARNGFGELMDQREYDAAIRDARTSRHDELAGAAWTPYDWVWCEGWLAVSDHPDQTRTPLDDLEDAVGRGEVDLRPAGQAVLVRLADEDAALVEVTRQGRRPIAFRANVDAEGFFSPGRWEPNGELVAESGTLRIGKQSRRFRGTELRVPRRSRWQLETYIVEAWGECIGLRLRRLPD